MGKDGIKRGEILIDIMGIDPGQIEYKFNEWEEKFAWLPKRIVYFDKSYNVRLYKSIWLKKYYERKVIEIFTFGGGGELWGEMMTNEHIERKEHLFDFLKG